MIKAMEQCPAIAESLLIIAAKAVCGSVSSKEMQSAINQVLEAGIYFDEFLDVLSADEIFNEIYPFFQKALEKLEIPIPTEEEATFLLIDRCMHKILEKKVSPRILLHQLFADLNEDRCDIADKLLATIRLSNYSRHHSDCEYCVHELEDHNQEAEEEAKKWCSTHNS